MARAGEKMLDQGERFPTMRFPLLDGGEAVMPGFVGPDYGVLLVYRGSW